MCHLSGDDGPSRQAGPATRYSTLPLAAFGERAALAFATGGLALLFALAGARLADPLPDDRPPSPVSRPRLIICAKSSIRVGVTGCEVKASRKVSSTMASASASPQPRGSRWRASRARDPSTTAAETPPSSLSRVIASLHIVKIDASAA